MLRLHAPVAAAFALLALAACEDAESKAPPPQARYAPARPPVVDLQQHPFPSEAYRTADGRLQLVSAPGESAFVRAALLPALADIGAFGTQQPVHFGIAGALQQPWPITRTAGAAGFVDIDPASPTYGRALPAELLWDERRGLLSVTPALGRPLPAGGHVLAYLTDDLQAPDGTPLAAAPAFARVRDGNPLGAAEAAAAARLDAALDVAATALGRARTELVAASLVRLQEPTATAQAAVAQIVAAAAPAPSAVSAWADSATAVAAGLPPLDALYGVPESPARGLGHGGVVHGHIRATVELRLDLVQWSDAVGHQPFRIDAAGAPVSRGTITAEALLVLPRCAPPAAGFPAVLAQHGLGNDKSFALVLADALAERCLATVAIDAPAHASRARTARDRQNNITHDNGADGIGDRWDLAGFDQVYLLQPLVARDNLRQTALDLVQLSDSLARADWTTALWAAGPLTAAWAELPAGTPLIDPGRLAYVGQSMGAITGSLALALDPYLRAGIPNVGGGNFARIFTEAPAFNQLAFGVAAAAEGDPTAPLRRDHPLLGLLQGVLDGADPISYARHWFRAPTELGKARHVLLQVAAWDQLVPTSASEGLAIAGGLPALGDYPVALRKNYAFAPRPLPAGATTTAADGSPISAGLVMFPVAEHGFLNVHEGTLRYRTDPPWGQFDEVRRLFNPTDAAHTQMARFLSEAMDGVPTIGPVAAGEVGGVLAPRMALAAP